MRQGDKFIGRKAKIAYRSRDDAPAAWNLGLVQPFTLGASTERGTNAMARNWFVRSADVDRANGPEGVAAYQDGRRDERRLAEKTESAHRVDRAEQDKAYDRGFQEGRRRSRGSGAGLLLTAILLVLAVGEALLVAREGSFTLAGVAVDQSLASMSDRATAPVRAAAVKTGDALQNAGANLKQKAGSVAP